MWVLKQLLCIFHFKCYRYKLLHILYLSTFYIITQEHLLFIEYIIYTIKKKLFCEFYARQTYLHLMKIIKFQNKSEKYNIIIVYT